MKAKHTPGPWKAEAIEGNVIVFDSNHHCVCEVAYSGPKNANAKLIAAAPDMLESLKYIAKLLGSLKVPQGETEDMAYSEAVKAIKKATS